MGRRALVVQAVGARDQEDLLVVEAGEGPVEGDGGEEPLAARVQQRLALGMDRLERELADLGAGEGAGDLVGVVEPFRGASASGRSATLASGSCVPAAPSSAAGPMRTRPPVSHVPRHQVRARHPGSRATCTRGRPPASALSRPAVLAAHMLSTWPVSSMRSSGEYHTSQGRSASAAVGRMPSSGSPSGREMPPEREMLEELSE